MAKDVIVKQVDVMALMGALQTTGKAKLSDFATPIDDEVTELSPLETAFRERKEKGNGAMLIIRQQHEYYWMLYEDATEAAQVLGLTVEKFGSRLTPRIRFHHKKLDTYLPMLVRAGKRVAIQEKIIINNNQTSEDETMKKNEKNNETKNVQNAAQVSNPVTTDADVAEVNDIVPVVTKRAVAEAMVQAANGGDATTIPLSDHGTLVVAGVGGTKADVPQTSDIKPQTSTKVQDSVPQGKLQYVTYEKQKTNKTTGKPYTVTHGKIMGFAATDEAYQRGVELHGAVSGEMVDGVKVLGLYFSHRYAAAAKDVCDALNAGKPFAECVAIIDNATEENARKREEWKAKIEERKAAREAKKAEKTNTNRTNDTNQPTAGYSAQDVAAMLQKVLAGGELPKDVEALMKKAA